MYGNICIAGGDTGFTAQVIKKLTKSKYSHSLITIPDCLGVPMCMEAADVGIACLPFELGYRNNPEQIYVVYRLNLPQETKDAAIRAVLPDLQKSYGFLELPWFIWRSLNRFFGRDIKGQDNWSQAGIICSEFCVGYLTACGLGHLFKDFGKGSVNAQDVLDIMDANPDLFTKCEERSVFSLAGTQSA